MESFELRLDQINQQHENDLKWMKECLQELASVTKSRDNAVIDLETERDAKRELHKAKEGWKAKYEELQRFVDRSSFILVLVDADADGYVFDDEYLLKGSEGGRQAAHDLTDCVKRYFRENFQQAADITCYIKLYANVDSLKLTMLNHGMHEHANSLRDFCKGFCQMGGMSEFIDVGGGDDQADHQIKGVLKHFKDNPSCKHIVLGSCHDNGYVSPLKAIAPDEPVRKRITLLKSFKTGRQFDKLPFKSTSFQTLFRDQPFPTAVRPLSPESSGNQSGTKVVTETSSGASYATIVGHTNALSEKPNGSNSGTVFGPIGPRQIYVNARKQRVNAPLPKPSNGAWNSFDRKKAAWKLRGKKGPCNQHLLLNQCPLTAETCSFFHGRLSESEMLVQKTILRKLACEFGSGCRRPSCFYGHQCVCTNAICKFRKEEGDMHDIDMSGIHILTCE